MVDNIIKDYITLGFSQEDAEKLVWLNIPQILSLAEVQKYLLGSEKNGPINCDTLIWGLKTSLSLFYQDEPAEGYPLEQVLNALLQLKPVQSISPSTTLLYQMQQSAASPIKNEPRKQRPHKKCVML